MEFCPTDGNLLQFEPAGYGQARFFCPICPYIAPIVDSKIKIKKKQPLTKKEIEPIFSGEDAMNFMKFAPQTQAVCPSCHHGKAYFREFQTRSADEPTSKFYRCCNTDCNFDWRED